MVRILFFIVLIVFMGCSNQKSSSNMYLLNDENLILFFKKHKTQFDEIITYSEKNKKDVSHINLLANLIRNKKLFSPYYEKFNASSIYQLDSTSLVIIPKNSKLSFKSFYFSKKKPINLFDNLDTIPNGIKAYDMFYRKIDKNWYISRWNPFDPSETSD